MQSKQASVLADVLPASQSSSELPESPIEGSRKVHECSQTGQRKVRFEIAENSGHRTEDCAAESTAQASTQPSNNKTDPPLRSAEKPILDHIASHLQFLALLTLRLSTEALADVNEYDFPSSKDSSTNQSSKRRIALEIKDNSSNTGTTQDLMSDSDPDWDQDKETYGEGDADDWSATTVMEDLLKRTQQKLRSSSRVSKHRTRRWFIPYDKLRAILTRKRIRSILLQTATFTTTPPDILDTIARNICGRTRKPNGRRTGYIRIFGILVLIDQVKYIRNFLNELITDADLPLRLSPNHSLGSNLVLRNSDDDDCDPPLSCFENWTPEHMDNFIGQQEKLVSPRFRMRGDQLCLHRLRSNIILPFIECGKEAFFGGFGRVSKVKIHPGHCDFDPKTLPHASNLYGASFGSQENGHTEHEFALKEIQSDDYTIFRAEVGVHEKISASRNGHEHLIRLLAAVEHGENYYLLFPWAQGTLVDLWQRFQASPNTSDDVEWLIKQCLGVTDGLQRIHQYKSSWKDNDQDRERSLSKNKGTHGDVKAEHILVFDPPESDTFLGNKHLVVSDFGLTRFREESQAYDPHGWSRTYRAPELDMQHGTSRKYDVWSLGCLFLEFTSWFLLGFDATRSRLTPESGSLKSFQDVRIEDDAPFGTPFKEDKFFNLIQAPGFSNIHTVVKPSVLEWIDKLRQLNECSEPIRAFLHLIHSKMLVVDKDERGSMIDIRDGLRKIYDDHYRTARNFISSEASLHVDEVRDAGQHEVIQTTQSHSQRELESHENSHVMWWLGTLDTDNRE
ncbi:hypothetical protein E8E14_007440 [Neopestalotiopsis sp. 37M]|nr:hypothetical protein E8E14_007440 [Neopestalotiopsis sp. 37M]